MALAALGGIWLLGVAWVFWKLVKGYVVRSPLDNIPGPRPKKYTILGDMPSFFSRHAFPFHKEIWDNFDGVARINTLFGRTMLYVYDPKALHHIVVKDQYTYEETPLFLKFNRLLFGHSLLSSVGDEHKHQRKILNPVFHTNHMRYMLPTFYRIVYKLRDAVAREVKEGEREIDMLNWMTRTALELVGQGGLGHSFDDLDRDGQNPFAEVMKSVVPTFSPLFAIVSFLPLALRIASPATWRKFFEKLPFKYPHDCLAIVDAMDSTSRAILAQKKDLLAKGDAAFEHQVGEGRDIMSVLLRANMHASAEDKMSDDELLGHMSSLIFAGMETTSGALAHILEILAEHAEVQEKLRQEISAARAGREHMDFDELMGLPYLEAVCRETLRLYSPATHMVRQTTQEVILPLSRPIRGIDGTMMSEICLPPKASITIGILGCNWSKSIWGPDAHVWRPERWLEPLPDSVAEARVPGVYSNLMTFLGGGRACIGFKFSQMEMKVVLSVLLENFEFRPSGKEVYWNWNMVQFPTVGQVSTHTKMPLRVKLIQSKA